MGVRAFSWTVTISVCMHENTYECMIYMCYLPAAKSEQKKYFPEVSEAAEAEGRGTLLRPREIFF
jgi:hypothetical protein